MFYKTIRKDSEMRFVEELNDAVKRGYRAISVGASFDPMPGRLVWWAIMEKPEEAQAAPETQKDERAELLEALANIKRACAERSDCSGCEFFNGHTCNVSDWPEHWIVYGG